MGVGEGEGVMDLERRFWWSEEDGGRRREPLEFEIGCVCSASVGEWLEKLRVCFADGIRIAPFRWSGARWM